MSTTMQAYCPLHEEAGPRIHRNAGGAAGLWPSIGGDIFDDRATMLEWNVWIQQHEFCDFIVRRSA